MAWAPLGFLSRMSKGRVKGHKIGSRKKKQKKWKIKWNTWLNVKGNHITYKVKSKAIMQPEKKKEQKVMSSPTSVEFQDSVCRTDKKRGAKVKAGNQSNSLCSLTSDSWCLLHIAPMYVYVWDFCVERGMFSSSWARKRLEFYEYTKPSKGCLPCIGNSLSVSCYIRSGESDWWLRRGGGWKQTKRSKISLKQK